jgi:hypothetical protein
MGVVGGVGFWDFGFDNEHIYKELKFFIRMRGWKVILIVVFVLILVVAGYLVYGILGDTGIVDSDDVGLDSDNLGFYEGKKDLPPFPGKPLEGSGIVVSGGGGGGGGGSGSTGGCSGSTGGGSGSTGGGSGGDEIGCVDEDGGKNIEFPFASYNATTYGVDGCFIAGGFGVDCFDEPCYVFEHYCEGNNLKAELIQCDHCVGGGCVS